MPNTKLYSITNYVKSQLFSQTVNRKLRNHDEEKVIILHEKEVMSPLQ